MMYWRKLTIMIVFMAILCLATVAFVENIDPQDDGSQYAYGENVGWLNAEPGGNGGPGVTVTDAAVTGYMWGENIGWINLSPTSYGGVVNDGTGNLSGYAWGENVGWINFAPLGNSVTIDYQGNFDGWAWGENIGWIHFQNPSIPYKVQTAWPVIPTVGSCGIDIYPNRTPNRVFLSRNYTLYVSVLGSDTFDVTTLNSSTVKFGKTGTEASPMRAPLIRDLNWDGFIDAMYGFRTFDCGFQLGDTEGWLKGYTVSGTLVEGSDSVLVLP
jgi:hypothetical protein